MAILDKEEKIDNHLRKYWNERLKSGVPFSQNENNEFLKLIKTKILTLNQVCKDQNIKGTQKERLFISIRSFLTEAQLKEFDIEPT